ncbi:MAG: glycerol-3-phosphate dehydrogenase/oxidase [Gemmatimonadota bacterium]|nr:MAG: glycerol-3-phosphate dehydrogenase/oxidase [Gemmatimonadota bacterium]
MTTEPVDLLVIGGGITGAGIARDAAMRGLHTAVIDQGDFGSGTSSRSSRLVHGGLRYLEHGHLYLVFEACRERRVLLRIAPHLVRPRSFLFPVHEGARVPLWKLEAGMWLYDILSMFRNVKRHRVLSRKAMQKAEPRLKNRGLKGGTRYYDAQCDDARLTLATIRSAHQHGALAANYVQVERLELADGTTRGAHVTDLVTGRTHSIHAHVVVNATGPWSDRIRRQDGSEPVLRPTKGVHIAVPRHRMGNQEALTITSPIDGRVMFIIPWGELSYVGTTDTDCPDLPEETFARGEDVVYLLRSANALFPDARLTPEDVVATWSGLRPLLAPSDPLDPSSVSREHRVLESPSGLISTVGGKLTTYRVMAAETVDLVSKRLHEIDGRPMAAAPATHLEPLPGGESRDLEVLIEEAEREGMARDIAEHMVRAYGSETPAIVRLAKADRDLAEPISPRHPAIRAELIHAMRREMAITLGDLLIRRTHLFYELADHATGHASLVADLASAEMGWDTERTEAELAAYRNEVDLTMAFRTELAAAEVS